MRLLASGLAPATRATTLGADSLAITEAEFGELVRSRRSRIKALLLDQGALSGMGNIYTDEALWRSRIHPTRLGANLKAGEIAKLYAEVRAVLNEAIALKGSSVSDYVDTEGNRGEFQTRHRVYQRTGEPCFRCGTKIRRSIVAGRSSHFCPKCQPAPRTQRASGPRKPRRGSRVTAKPAPSRRSKRAPKTKSKSRRAA
jgi:formamidopyrimidine-DNA glycosylase